jgi:hypothetical protein
MDSDNYSPEDWQKIMEALRRNKAAGLLDYIVMKKYLIQISAPGGVIAAIGFYADTPGKNYRIYYCGSDTGARFERLGNAAHALEKLAAAWENNNVPQIKKTFGTLDDIPRHGSNA